MNGKELALAATVIVLLALAVLFFSVKSSSNPQGFEGKPAAIGNDSAALANWKEGKFPHAPKWEAYLGGFNGGESLSSEKLKGKVYLVDIWTYSCINCIRTLPYIKSWYGKYRPQGLVVVGVHSPEFDFEKLPENVQMAVEKFGLEYPVVIDSERRIWSAFNNAYWPRKYLVDGDGYIRYDHIGEGEYEETEKAVEALLVENGADMAKAQQQNVTPENVDFYKIGTPEIYFGGNFRRQEIGNGNIFMGESKSFAIPKTLAPSVAYLEGEWKDNGDYIELESEKGAIGIIYNAKNLHFVASSENGSRAYAIIDGRNSTAADDVATGFATITSSRLYRIGSAENYGTHKLRIEIEGKGLRAYAFTFG